ncbi:IS1634 family transposase [Candidatus Bipolaricaulota sp. J31]
MFVRAKRVGKYTYLQLVENRREGGKVRQRVLCTLGRMDVLAEKGGVDAIILSLAKFAEKVKVQEAYREGEIRGLGERVVGPALIFGRLWEELGVREVLEEALSGRKFTFPVERVVFASVLHRLFEGGSDRQCERFLRDVWVPGLGEVGLQHLYRAMRFLGEEKDRIEEGLFLHNRDLFSELRLVFFDTTSFYFHGEGGELGARGYSRDRRPELKQVVVGALLAGDGRPISCGVWPGDFSDVKALLAVVDRVKERFPLGEVCFVADRGMVSREVIRELEDRGIRYILGMRLRKDKEVRDEVLSRPGRYGEVEENLQVKEVWVEDRRYILCYNPKEAEREARERELILESLREKLSQGPKALLGNRGFRRYLKAERGTFRIDPKKVAEEARYDGKWVLRTNTDLPASEVALQYKRLLCVEEFFRAAKSLLETRPIFHKFASTITGHIFVSFLALLLMHELEERLKRKGLKLEWKDVVRDLLAVREVEVKYGGKRYMLRLPLVGVAGKVFGAVGVAVPPPVRETCGAKIDVRAS